MNDLYFECCQAAKTLGHKDDCSNNPKNTQKMTIAFDDPVEKNVMQLTIPLKKIALDQSGMQAMIEFYGFFEVAKDTAIAALHTHRMKGKRQSLIIPGNGATQSKIKLEI